MAAVCKIYGAACGSGRAAVAAAGARRRHCHDVMVTASGLLKAANLAVFELGMGRLDRR